METKPEIVARLAKQGGYILLVGGGLNEMGEPYTTHPQIIIWDDQVMNGVERKVIPSNTRAILCSKWASHAIVWHIQEAATHIHSVVFPQLTKREIKEMLVDVIHEPPVELPIEPELPDDEGIVISMNEDAPVMETDKGYLTGDEIMRKPKRGEIHEILAKEFNPNYEIKADEIRRLVPIFAKKYGIKQTEGGLYQTILIYEKNQKHKVKGTPVIQKEAIKVDDFTEAERILKDAKAAIDLMLDFIPKLRKEVEVHRSRMSKLRAFLGDD